MAPRFIAIVGTKEGRVCAAVVQCLLLALVCDSPYASCDANGVWSTPPTRYPRLPIFRCVARGRGTGWHVIVMRRAFHRLLSCCSRARWPRLPKVMSLQALRVCARVFRIPVSMERPREVQTPHLQAAAVSAVGSSGSRRESVNGMDRAEAGGTPPGPLKGPPAGYNQPRPAAGAAALGRRFQVPGGRLPK